MTESGIHGSDPVAGGLKGGATALRAGHKLLCAIGLLVVAGTVPYRADLPAPFIHRGLLPTEGVSATGAYDLSLQLRDAAQDASPVTSVDADGVAPASVQGLNQMLQEQDAELAVIRELNRSLLRHLAALDEKPPDTGAPAR